jgi:hypothetical protein
MCGGSGTFDGLLLNAPKVVHGTAFKKKDYLAGAFISGFFFINNTIASIIVRMPAIIRLRPVM